MKKQLLLFTILLATTAMRGLQQPDVPPTLSFAPAAPAADQREDELYRDGTDYVNDGKWQAALDKFTQVSRLGGSKADGASYWMAYSQNKLGQRAAALETIAGLSKKFPASTWVKDARALEIEIRANSGQAARPQDEPDEDLKLQVLNGMMAMDPGTAFPILEKIVNGNQSPKLKERALFVLAQSDSPKAQQLIGQIARGQANPELQRKAIRQLGIRGDRELLGQIYSSGSNPEVKKEVLRSLGICGGKQQLLAAAKGEQDLALRREAIRSLAVAGGKEELRQLYSASTDAGTRSELIRSTVVSGDRQLLSDILKTETDPKVKTEAIRSMAVSGGKDELRQLYSSTTDPATKVELIRSAVVSGDQQMLTTAMNDADPKVKLEAIRTFGVTGGGNVSQILVDLYNKDQNRDVREAVTQALFVHGDAHSLVELARKETDPEMKKRLVEKLSIMGHNKEAVDYLMQLLEK